MRNYWLFRIILIPAALICFLPVSLIPETAADITISINQSHVESLLGDKIRLHIVAVYPESLESLGISPPEWGEIFHIYKIDLKKPVEAGNRRKSRELDIIFSIFDTGDIKIPSVIFRFSDKNKKINEYPAYPGLIHVKSLVQEDDRDIKDIKGPRSIPSGSRIYWILIVGGLILICCIIFIILKKKRVKKSLDDKEADPAHIEAYRSLDALSRENLLSKGEYKKYYVLLSEVIKRYLFRRFSIDTLEMTTREIMREIIVKDLSREARHSLKEFFNECDLVKFAKHVPTGSEAREALESAYHFVDITREETLLQGSESPMEEKHPRPKV